MGSLTPSLTYSAGRTHLLVGYTTACIEQPNPGRVPNVQADFPRSDYFHDAGFSHDLPDIKYSLNRSKRCVYIYAVFLPRDTYCSVRPITTNRQYLVLCFPHKMLVAGASPTCIHCSRNPYIYPQATFPV